jgi:phosphoglycolate phosphatase-like HAD superfamily hydrolase
MKSRSAAARPAIRSNTRRCIWTACTRAFTHRLEELRRHDVSPDKYLVPGARASIEALRERGLRLYLASGTDQPFMREEAALLDIARYFEGRVYGALDDYRSFSKKILIERLIAASEFKARNSWASAMATWRSRISRRWAAWLWAWPPRSPSAAPWTMEA